MRLMSLLYDWWRAFRPALRLLPINDLSPRVIARHRTIPLCFERTISGPVRPIRRLYQLVFMGRRAPKQPYLYDRIVFHDSYGFPKSSAATMSPGDYVVTRLAVGESATHLLRSASYSANDREMMLAIATTNAAGDTFRDSMRCLYVRYPARISDPGEDGLRDNRIIWHIISPSQIGASTDCDVDRDAVPRDAMRLYPSGQTDPYSPEDIDSHRPRLIGGAILYEYGSTMFRGLIALSIKSLLIGAAIIGTKSYGDPIVDEMNSNVVLAGVAIAAIIALILYCARRLTPYDLRQWRPAMFGVALPARLVNPRFQIKCLSGRVRQRLLWHGSSRRALAIGDHCRNVATSWKPF